jgi:uncharacterized protein YycO
MKLSLSTCLYKPALMLCLLVLLGFISNAQNTVINYKPQNGDIIFHQSKSKQSNAIKLATKSKYTHCGIIYVEGGKAYVLEAEGPVISTPLMNWILRGKNHKYVIKRLSNAAQVITPAALEKMKSIGKTFMGKLYDQTFEWSDSKMYCSELVWKIYDRALGIKIGETKSLRDFDLNNKIVYHLLKKRYPGKIPYDETVISPSAIFDSGLLITVAER